MAELFFCHLVCLLVNCVDKLILFTMNGLNLSKCDDGNEDEDGSDEEIGG